MKLTIGIKALNEERYIAASLASAVAAARPWNGEVILADSGSTDKTVEIARTFPVRIVQLSNPADKSCGAGAQLAFQHAQGEFFYLLDGDMVLNPEFIAQGIAYLERDPRVAGVGGIVQQMNTEGEEFQIRAAVAERDSHWRAGQVDRLDCGGLYRTAAIREVGYFADRNLHAFEEFELAARLRSRGWKLARIDLAAVEHYGHTIGGYKLLWKRVKSGYSGATGEVLRSALGKPQLPIVLRDLNHIRNCAVVMMWWLLLVACLFAPFSIPLRIGLLAALFAAPLAGFSWRRKSLNLGVYSFVAWNVGAWGLLSGVFRKRVPPTVPLAARDISRQMEAAAAQ